MRKKRVKLLKTSRRPDGEAMIVRRPRRAEELVVYVFDLPPERSEILRSRLRAIFEGAEIEEVLAPGQLEAVEHARPSEAAGEPPEG
jgi:hypothetical protein